MDWTEFAAGDLVKLIEGAPGESKAIWRINHYLSSSGAWKLEKYNGPEAVSRKMTTKKENVRGLREDELDSLAMWSRGSFVRTTYQGITYIGRVRRIIWDGEKGVSAHVTLAGQCIPEGISKSGEPESQRIKHYTIILEEAKLKDCTKPEVEWLEDHFARVPEKFILPKPKYEYSSGHWYVTETVNLTSALEIVEAAAKVKEQYEAGPTKAHYWIFGCHEDENGERVYTKEKTRRLDSEEVEQLGLRLEEQKRNGNPRNERFTSATFDDYLHPDKIFKGVK